MEWLDKNKKKTYHCRPVLALVQKGGEITMKQTYETPKLSIHGTVEQMTQMMGSSSASDAIIWGNLTFDPPGFNGSQDLVIPT